MKTIWKFPIDGIAVTEVHMPKGAKVIRISEQDGDVVLWALVNITAKPEVRRFHIQGTGHPIGRHQKYIGSVTIKPFEWHVFEEKRWWI